ncbi:MAG TPA: glycosyl hydrolase family 28-related protein [Chitinophaga sp.]
MNNHHLLLFFLLLVPLLAAAQEKRGADIPWTTYEAENMHTTGIVLGPRYDPYQVETESSGQRCVRLNGKGKYVEFTAAAQANSLVIRYSLPDAAKGGGLHSTLGVYKNGRLAQHCSITSTYCMLYGKYPFSNDPDSGRARNFYDEVRLRDLPVAKGDVIRIQLDPGALDVNTCIIDLADLELVAPPLPMPANAVSLATFSDGSGDYTRALRDCISAAARANKIVWLPAGAYKITGDIVVPSDITIQGAGMWYSTLEGDAHEYNNASGRVRIKGNGSNIHLADFAITGKLNYRSDHETNDGIFGSYGSGSTISRLWIEHTKVGMWIENSSGLQIEGCRMRNTIADGINFCVGMYQSTIRNCTTRGGGDDCFAIWPAPFRKQEFTPGHNLITHCTGQLVFLANGAAVYGGESNVVQNCSFSDITPGCAILVSSTFPTENDAHKVHNNFSGNTVIENCDIRTSGGFDHEWDWRGAVEVCVDKRNIAGLVLRDLHIENSLSNAITIRGKNAGTQTGALSNALLENITVQQYGLGTKAGYGLYIAPDTHGDIMVKTASLGAIKNDATSFTIQ